MLPLNRRDDLPFLVTAICGTTSQHGMMEQLRAQYPELELLTDDYRDLIADRSLDIIAVFSPDPLHFIHCRDALAAGKHVVCTKPLVTSLSDAAELVRLTREKNLKFLVGQTMRYEPQFASVKRMFDDGQLGEAIMAEAHYVHDMRPVYDATPWRIEMPQDVMFGGTSHPVDVLRWFFGDVDTVHCISCRGGMYRSAAGKAYEADNNFMLNLKFKNGVCARVLGAYGIVEPPMPMMGITVYGTEGTATGEFSDFLGGRVRAVFDKFEIKSPFEALYPPEKDGAFGHGRTLQRYMEHFADCLENDLRPCPDVLEGAKTIAVCCAAYESARTGETVKVQNEF